MAQGGEGQPGGAQGRQAGVKEPISRAGQGRAKQMKRGAVAEKEVRVESDRAWAGGALGNGYSESSCGARTSGPRNRDLHLPQLPPQSAGPSELARACRVIYVAPSLCIQGKLRPRWEGDSPAPRSPTP